MPIACHTAPRQHDRAATAPDLRHPTAYAHHEAELERRADEPADQVEAQAQMSEVVDLELGLNSRSRISSASRSTNQGGLEKVPGPKVMEAGLSVAIGTSTWCGEDSRRSSPELETDTG